MHVCCFLLTCLTVLSCTFSFFFMHTKLGQVPEFYLCYFSSHLHGILLQIFVHIFSWAK